MKRLRMWFRLIWIDLTQARKKMFRPMVTWDVSATLIRRGIDDPMEVVRFIRMGVSPSTALDLASPPSSQRMYLRFARLIMEGFSERDALELAKPSRFMDWEDAIFILNKWPDVSGRGQ